MSSRQSSYEFLEYLKAIGNRCGEMERLPSLKTLSEELGISISRLREQMEVARAFGFIEVRPRTGIRRLPYIFFPAVKQSLSYALSLDKGNFAAFADLRGHIEAAYWYQAVSQLTKDDHEALVTLMEEAWNKLRGSPVRIPQTEHRELHLMIYRRLDNPFVLGILESYWDAYEAVGLNLYADYHYLQKVWEYHQRMVDAICSGDFEVGYYALVEHTDLIDHRAVTGPEDEVMILRK